MSFTIEANIPVPARIIGARSSKYPFESMQIGDSFFIPVNPENPKDNINRTARRAASAVNMARKALPNIKLVTRRGTANGVEGYRVWRIA